MLETSARLLRLLSLMQSRRDWKGSELADRLGVSGRTVRNDVDRLRRLGYPVEAGPGPTGGYRLGAGGSLPPLLLEDDEAVAVAVGLRTAANGSVKGIEEASVQALAKLKQVIPARLRQRITDVEHYAISVAGGGPTVDPDVLVAIAAACRNSECVRFDYRPYAGDVARRVVEPYRLINDRRRWYLFAWDLGRSGWRTFRADRIELRPPHGPRFVARPLPADDDIAVQVSRGVLEAVWRYRADIVVAASAAHVRSRLPVAGDLRELADNRCAVRVGSDDPATLALYLVQLDADFTVVGAPELVEAVLALAGRLQRAVAGSRG